MKARRITSPAKEAVTVVDLRAHLRVTSDDEDGLLKGLIDAATEMVEDWTGRAIMTQTWEYYLDAFPRDSCITLPYGNLQDVPLTQFVKWKDSDGVETTLVVTTDYLWETNGDQHGRVVLPYSRTWPTGTFYPSNPVTIRFVCGWTVATSVPLRIRQAIMMVAADLYENRGERIIGQTVVENKAVDALLASNRLWGNF